MSEEKEKYGSLDWLHKPLPKCPICGKEFLPAHEHAYKIRVKKSDGHIIHKKVCSYECMRKYEKRIEEAKKELEARKNG